MSASADTVRHCRGSPLRASHASPSDGVTFPMPDARTDTTEARPLEASQAAAAGSGRHRGPASPEDNSAPAHGKHRRTPEGH
ncbi:hypothetical protein GCM10010324_16800 [Streptomyces hiroshimensis]|uniref:Uncharacterized protein n=1 Tax=Streptomyces hiroshimensis TaxID=66424 RepID=A0ABQ2Y9F9_9ACTN|nr:hypothetical protein GCM10010324_16800 [Streptomyces hiroshimensis]